MNQPPHLASFEYYILFREIIQDGLLLLVRFFSNFFLRFRNYGVIDGFCFEEAVEQDAGRNGSEDEEDDA